MQARRVGTVLSPLLETRLWYIVRYENAVHVSHLPRTERLWDLKSQVHSVSA